MCAISINSYDWDSRESEGNRPKSTPLPHERLKFMPLLQRGRFSEMSLGVSTLQAADPPYSVNIGPIGSLIQNTCLYFSALADV